MGLQDLSEDIYSRDFENERSTKTVYDPDDTRQDTAEPVGFGSEHWDGSQVPVRKTVIQRFVGFFRRHWPWYLLGLGVLAVFAVAVNFTVLRSVVFSADRVRVEVSGPTEVASGETVSYRIGWHNDNTLRANDAEVEVSFPDTFRLEETTGFSVEGNVVRMRIGDIGRSGSGEASISGKFYGAKGSLVYVNPVIRFRPSGLTAVFESRNQTGVTVVSSPLFLEVTAPLEAASGNEIEYVVAYRNDSDLSYANLRLKTEYPEGFRFAQADPRPTEGDGLWRIGSLLPGASGEIRVKGVQFGENDQGKVVRASLGVLEGDGAFVAYETKERLTRMVVSPLSITQTVNGRSDLSVSPGDVLRYDLRYVNNGDIGFRDVIIMLELNPELLDMTALTLSQRGSYDVSRNRIVWTAADFPELSRLEPNEGGTVTFSVPLRKDIGTSGEAGKHLSIRTKATIDSPDIPFTSESNKIIASNAIEVRVGSVMEFGVLGFHTDTPIPNSGPVPLKVGQETTYMFRFTVTNYLNDLSGARVTINLPTGVRYTGKYLPEGESVEYNDRTGQLVWDIGTLLGGGRTSRDLSLQVGITPGPDLIGRSPRLLLNSVFEAKDSFAGNEIRIERSEKTTSLREDRGLSAADYAVIP